MSLSDVELTDMAERLDMQDEHMALDDAAKSQLGDSYGGVWISQRKGGKFVVASTQPIRGAERKAITNATSHRNRVQFVRAPASARVFQELHDQLEAISNERPDEIGSPVYLPEQMVVAISATSSAIDLVRAEVSEAVDVGIVDITPVRSIDTGTADTTAGTALNPECTMGPWAFWQWGSLRIPAMTTAGHCKNRLRPTGSLELIRFDGQVGYAARPSPWR